MQGVGPTEAPTYPWGYGIEAQHTNTERPFGECQARSAKLAADGVDYALCGGLAMAVYAMPRATLDIDLMIQTESLAEAARSIEPVGYAMSGDPMDFQGGAVKSRRYCKVDADSAEALVLDFLLVTDETVAAWEGRRDVDWEVGTLRVLSPEGLILLKLLRGSGTDQDDIAYLQSITDED